MDNLDIHFEALIDKTFYEFKDPISAIYHQIGIFSQEINHYILMYLRGHAERNDLFIAIATLDNLLRTNQKEG
jgi:hypothetical protein